MATEVRPMCCHLQVSKAGLILGSALQNDIVQNPGEGVKISITTEGGTESYHLGVLEYPAHTSRSTAIP